MLKPPVSKAHISKINSGEVTETDDLLAVEEPLVIRLGYGDEKNRKQKTI
jgi:hypothetical protein